MTDAPDDRVGRVLEEMRDLQREHLGLYRQVLKNQEDALRLQRELQASARGRLRVISGLIGFVLVLIVIVLGLLMRRVF